MFSIHFILLVNKYSGCSLFLAVVTKTALNIHMQVFVCISLSTLGNTLRSETEYDKSVYLKP